MNSCLPFGLPCLFPLPFPPPSFFSSSSYFSTCSYSTSDSLPPLFPNFILIFISSPLSLFLSLLFARTFSLFLGPGLITPSNFFDCNQLVVSINQSKAIFNRNAHGINMLKLETYKVYFCNTIMGISVSYVLKIQV